MIRNRNEPVYPDSKRALDNLKYDVSRNLGILPRTERRVTEEVWDQVMEQYKDRVIREMGLKNKIEQRGWGNMPSRECGAVGGRMGGHIGGQMVRRLIRYSQQNMLR